MIWFVFRLSISLLNHSRTHHRPLSLVCKQGALLFQWVGKSLTKCPPLTGITISWKPFSPPNALPLRNDAANHLTSILIAPVATNRQKNPPNYHLYCPGCLQQGLCTADWHKSPMILLAHPQNMIICQSIRYFPSQWNIRPLSKQRHKYAAMERTWEMKFDASVSQFANKIRILDARGHACQMHIRMRVRADVRTRTYAHAHTPSSRFPSS